MYDEIYVLERKGGIEEKRARKIDKKKEGKRDPEKVGNLGRTKGGGGEEGYSSLKK